MAYKAFFDANIILDFLLEERENHIHVEKNFFHVQNATLGGYISETVLMNIAYILRKTQAVELKPV
ncbi:MAG: hypothetical protein ICV51_22265 [Flavisolibacter sp.]|nr:hypothetical protein [Flavisolibacter sp.]MBD0352574.1 hypothetical protein [Flavisolibacter sp.]MBD0378340.1 hypothetical protein [Flavisolibacter sp.]